MVQEITDKNYAEIFAKNTKPILIDFWAERCGPCKMVSPSIESLGNEYSDGALVAKIDADENPELTAKYGIRNIPTILYIKDGEIVDKHVGVASRGQLEDKLKSILD